MCFHSVQKPVVAKQDDLQEDMTELPCTLKCCYLAPLSPLLLLPRLIRQTWTHLHGRGSASEL